MKECNIPFCKEIPDTWKEVPNRYLFEYHSVKVGEKWKDYQLLSLTTGGVKEKDINASGGKVPDSYDKYQTVEPGDMIFCLFDLDVSAVFSGLSHHYGMITSAYEVVRPNYKILNQNFSDFWFQYVFTNRYYKMYSKNIRFTIGSDMFKAISTPIPPMEQQCMIADFLNRKTAEIDLLIEIENQQIEKLKEYKQAVITEAVTRGLDKDAPLKDSFVEWIGKIPEGWNTIKIKFTSWLKGRIGWDGLKSGEFIEEGPYLITGTDFIDGGINWDTCVHISEERFMEDELLHIYENDLLITKDGTIGKLAIVKDCPEKVSLNSGVMIIRNTTKWKYLDKYLYYILSSEQFYLWYGLSQSGNSTIKHLYQGQFYDFEFTYPDLNEQKKISDYLDEKCADIDKLIEIKKQKINQLDEYKKSLIYEYVTGKKEVC